MILYLGVHMSMTKFTIYLKVDWASSIWLVPLHQMEPITENLSLYKQNMLFLDEKVKIVYTYNE